jgi:hypothetical protein
MRVPAALLLLIFSTCSPAGEVYRSVDAQGHVTYSDQPSPNAQKVEINTGTRDLGNAQRIAHEQKLYQVEEAERLKAKAAEDGKQQKQDEARAESCKKAHDYLNRIKDVRHLYTFDEQGNRVFYSDKEADAQRAAAQQAVLTACES